MGLRVRVVADDEKEAIASVRDDDHPRLDPEFHYAKIRGRGLTLVGVAVRLRLGRSAKPLTITELRDLPLSRWEQAVRAHLGEAGRKLRSQVAARLSGKTLREAVARVQPELLEAARVNPTDGRVQRSVNAAMRLAEVADWYRIYVATGTSNPSAAVAEKFDMNPSAARARIHRARQKGYLGPAPGPTPGEETEEVKREGKR